MAFTTKQLHTLLDPDEPDYSQIRALLQHDDVAHLEQLAKEPDIMLASKATYAVSLIGTKEAGEALERLIKSPHVEVRTAIVSGLPNCKAGDVASLVTRLLGDKNVSVRKGAIKATRTLNLSATAAKLQDIANTDQVPGLRALAKDAFDAIH